MKNASFKISIAAIVGVFCLLLSACGVLPRVIQHDMPVRVGFFDSFRPISYSAGKSGAQHHIALGYEPDLLRAVAAIPGSGLSFEFLPIGGEFGGIWMKVLEPEYDLVCGGITILKERMKDAAGKRVIAFTRKHIVFRQSLLTPRESPLDSFADLRDRRLTVGAAPGTTGEEILLRFAGYISDSGVLAAGTRVAVRSADGQRKTVLADGSDRYRISAAEATPALAGRLRLTPPQGAQLPTVHYMTVEKEILAAFESATINAFVRGEVGNYNIVAETMNALKIAALFPENLHDPATEKGGCTTDIPDVALRNRLNRFIKYLTDSGRIGYVQWHANNEIFAERAAAWRP